MCGNTYILSKKSNPTDEKITIAKMSSRPFASGGFGHVHSVDYLQDAPEHEDIVKLARPGRRARNDVLREREILLKIHGREGKYKEGVQ